MQEAHVLEYKSIQGRRRPYPTHHGMDSLMQGCKVALESSSQHQQLKKMKEWVNYPKWEFVAFTLITVQQLHEHHLNTFLSLQLFSLFGTTTFGDIANIYS